MEKVPSTIALHIRGFSAALSALTVVICGAALAIQLFTLVRDFVVNSLPVLIDSHAHSELVSAEEALSSLSILDFIPTLGVGSSYLVMTSLSYVLDKEVARKGANSSGSLTVALVVSIVMSYISLFALAPVVD
ncbi:hypothetical protein [Idiomarina abyssalis]|uniref:Uncharacterized protein n=1 Tax=Idiomarina abyssalis TaxID=86102 RepID=A0A8I1GBA4_9GAMM|nr:hypothetical protein [Idiomarina abyssalis]MBJ7265431.1 hypothetical protein [Idiomarina abyssalis]MBJ7316895.1 hypothetical protein [Idiomarina abyssalis]